VNFGPLAAEIVSLVWGTPGNFNGFGVLAALLHGTLVVSVSQTAALNRGRHLYSAGRPSRWALAHISSYVYINLHVNAGCSTRYAVAVERELIMTNNLNIRFRHKDLQLECLGQTATFFSFSSMIFKEATWRITGNIAHSLNLILFSSLDYNRVRSSLTNAQQ